MSKEIIRQLKSLKHAETGPSEQWLQKNRELLLSQIKNTVPIKTKTRFTFNIDNFWQAASIFLPQSFVYKVIRPVTAMVLLVAMGVGGWVATVSASYESLPGDRLYSAKRAIEKTQSVVANVVGKKDEVAKLHLEFAKRRANETRDIISQNDPSTVGMAAQTVHDLKDEMKTVNSKLEEIKTTANSDVEIVKDINQNAQAIKNVLVKVNVDLLVADTAATGDLSTQVLEAKNLAKETSLKAVEVMVEKHLQGTGMAKDEVKQAIDEQLQSAVKDVADSKQSVVEVNKALGVVKEEVSAIVLDAKTNVNASSTESLSAKLEETSKQIQAAVNTSQQFNTETGKTITEAQLLLSQDNLSQAVDKVKALNATSIQVEKLTNDTLKAVQEILPVVAVVADTQLMVSSSTNTSSSLSSTLNIDIIVSSTKVSTTPTGAFKTTTTKP
jgi:hypothetical protein